MKRFRASLILALLGSGASLTAEPGVMVVDSVVGEVQAGGSADKLLMAQTYDPDGLTLSTGMNDYATLVFSNGVALYVAPNTELSIESFTQDPFESRADNLEFEPSRSDLSVKLTNGSIGIASRDANPLSRIIIDTGSGFSARIQSSAAAMQHDIHGTTVAIVKGRCMIAVDGQELLLREGYRYLKAPVGLDDPKNRISQLLVEENQHWSELARQAQVALDRWFFESEKNDDAIEVIRITPALRQHQIPFNNTKI